MLDLSIAAHREYLTEFIERALQEDVGPGDHSSLATIDGAQRGRARMICKSDGVLAGVAIVEFIFRQFAEDAQVEVVLHDGAKAEAGNIILYIDGYVRDILTLERLSLNIIQRLSGVATQTAILVKMLEGTGCKLLDTRKTTPNMRLLEKWAVTLGGGYNHRFGLFDMIMLKDNHIDASGSITAAISRTLAYKQENGIHIPVEIETRSLEDVSEVLKVGGVERIMLDNFSPELAKRAVEMIAGKFETECSGGITAQNIRAYAETGVDFISTGSVTHTVKSLDISLKIMNS